jgi:2-haloacid dehalogenase
MPFDRRGFFHLVAGGVTSGLLSPLEAKAATRPQIKAIAFDAFPIFDPRPVFRLAETLFPGKGADLSNAWRTRQFEYQWLRALSGHYADFLQTTEDGLVFAAKLLQLELTPEKRAQLMLRTALGPGRRPSALVAEERRPTSVLSNNKEMPIPGTRMRFNRSLNTS